MKNILQWAGICCLEMLLACPAFGLNPDKLITQYHQQVWTERDGLPQASVQAIVQTADGYLWLGTRAGLVRFDGVRFTVFTAGANDGLESNDIRSLYQDSHGRLWIGTFNGGLSCYEKGVFTHFGEEEGIRSGGVLDILEDRQGRLWFGTWNSLVVFQNGIYHEFNESNGLNGSCVWTLSEDHHGRIWIGTRNGLFVFDGGSIKPFAQHEVLSNNVIRAVYTDRAGAIWIGTIGAGLVRYKEGEIREFHLEKSLSRDRVQDIFEDRDGNVWIASWGGLSRIADDQITHFNSHDGLSHETVECLYEDREGNLWVGVRGWGLMQWRDAKFSAFTDKEGLACNYTKCVLEDRHGNLWIGTEGGGLTCRQPDGSVRNLGLEEDIPTPFVWSLAEDPEGGLWIGTGRPAHLVRLQPSGHNEIGRVVEMYGRREGLPVYHGIRCILVDHNGVLWLGGNGGGLCSFQKGEFTSIGKEQGLPSDLVRVIYEDRNKVLWVATNDGLCRFHGGEMEVFTMDQGLSHNAVYSIHEDKEGTLWLGTQAGLTRYRNGVFTPYAVEDGLVHNVLFRVLEDNAENLWISCDQGVFRIAKEDFDLFDEGKLSQLRCESYGVADGMKTAQCEGGSQPAGCKTANGAFWFPTVNGALNIHPERLQRNQLPPPTYIERVMANGAIQDMKQPMRFEAGSRDFHFHYTALSYRAPEKVQFKYRLEGLDKDWIEAGSRREAYYNSVPPGRYQFRVIACNNDRVWNTAGAVLPFVVEPQFHQTAWFWVACSLLIIVAGWSWHRWRLYRAGQQFNLILSERTRIARDLHDTLAQGFTGIKFQLEAVSGSLSHSPQKARKHLDLALQMVKHSLGEARRSVMNLRSSSLESKDIQTALLETAQQMVSDRKVKVECTTKGQKVVLTPTLENNLLRIGQEALTNALTYGRPSRVKIELQYHPRCVVLHVRDNGKGFVLNKVAENNNNHNHFGLLGMHERARQMGGELAIESGPGKGTHVRLEVPMTHRSQN